MLLRPSRFFDDLEVGEMRRSVARLVTEGEIIQFAQQYDPQWFHCEPEMARGSIFGGLVASGVQTIALWRRMDHEMNADIAFACGLGWDDVRWRHPLRAGDEIHATSKLLEKRASSSKHDRGYCRFASSVRLADGNTLLTFIGTNVVYTRASNAASDFGDPTGPQTGLAR